MNWRARYWQSYNIVVRAFGLAALAAGAWFTGLGAARLYQQGLVWSEGAPGLVLVAVGLLVSGLAAAILRTPAYRPDLGDAPWRYDGIHPSARPAGSVRSWWTGDR